MLDLSRIENYCTERSVLVERITVSRGLNKIKDIMVIIPDEKGGRVSIDILSGRTNICVKEIFYDDMNLITDEIIGLLEEWDFMSKEDAKHYFDWYFK